jgi:hypothetical protein
MMRIISMMIDCIQKLGFFIIAISP